MTKHSETEGGKMGPVIEEYYYPEDNGSPKPLGDRPLVVTRWMTAEEIEKVYGIKVVKEQG